MMPGKGVTLKEAIYEIENANGSLVLDLSLENIGNEGAELLANTIRRARFPITLDLTWNNIGNDGARALAFAIKEAKFPLTLDLSVNNIEDEGAEYIATAINEARVPLNLNLDNNNIGAAGAAALAEAMRDNFVIDAGTNLPKFFEEIYRKRGALKVLSKMYKATSQLLSTQTESSLKSSVLDETVNFVDDAYLALLAITSIRDVIGASHKNKYSNINVNVLMLDRKLHKLSDFISRTMPSLDVSAIPQGYVNVPSDGLCFYHAVARQLGGKSTARRLQRIAIDEVLNNPDRYDVFAEGDFDGFLDYHLQRQESDKGGWADNIMIQALANAIGHVIEIRLFDLNRNAIDVNPVRIVPQHVTKDQILRLGNIGNVHFVADANIPIQEGDTFGQLDNEWKIEEDDDIVGASQEDEGDEGEEEDWDQYRCETQDDSSAHNATSQVYHEELEFEDALSFELDAILLSGVNSAQ